MSEKITLKKTGLEIIELTLMPTGALLTQRDAARPNGAAVIMDVKTTRKAAEAAIQYHGGEYEVDPVRSAAVNAMCHCCPRRPDCHPEINTRQVLKCLEASFANVGPIQQMYPQGKIEEVS